MGESRESVLERLRSDLGVQKNRRRTVLLHRPDVLALLALVDPLKEMLAHDGGEGAKDFNAIKHYPARKKLQHALAALTTEQKPAHE